VPSSTSARSHSTCGARNTFDLDACLKACDAGGAVLESYCRSLSENWQQRLCWSVVLAKKTVCKGMCYRLNACATGADCPEREE
jgi:hypothetical protein